MKRRPSGRNKEQLPRAIEVGAEAIPVVKDAATFIYIANGDGTWPPRPITALLTDLPWMEEGATFLLKDLRPGESMGATAEARVIETNTDVEVHRGKWGQVRRRVLVEILDGDISFFASSIRAGEQKGGDS